MFYCTSCDRCLGPVRFVQNFHIGTIQVQLLLKCFPLEFESQTRTVVQNQVSNDQQYIIYPNKCWLESFGWNFILFCYESVELQLQIIWNVLLILNGLKFFF